MMPISDAYNKTDRLHQVQLLFWNNPGRRLRTREVAEKLGVSEDTAHHYLSELSSNGRLPLTKEGWYWQLAEGAKFELMPMSLNLSEGTALYLAARLLTQVQDERNSHVLAALSKLIGAMPGTITPHMHAVVEMARERQRGQQDTSNIFEALALGWATRRKVRLVYAPPHRKTFECRFAPFLLEPSAIGRTFYAIGYSSPPDELRTFKMERIEFAELTQETFEVPADFDGPALLSRAWGVMYGDEEPIEVRLRFSHWVTKRVKETLWHPSQKIQDTAEGCEWTAQIGDTLEIENWIRGWGADCEVLAPMELREKMVKEARRLAHMYGVVTKSTLPDEPDMGLLSRILGGE
jgi:predicted DNA-binding transcriptional regulator YafY